MFFAASARRHNYFSALSYGRCRFQPEIIVSHYYFSKRLLLFDKLDYQQVVFSTGESLYKKALLVALSTLARESVGRRIPMNKT